MYGQPDNVAHLDVYVLFDIHEFVSSRYEQKRLDLGEIDPLVRQIEEILAVTTDEITRRDQWGRYNLYKHNPESFTKHRKKMRFTA